MRGRKSLINRAANAQAALFEAVAALREEHDLSLNILVPAQEWELDGVKLVPHPTASGRRKARIGDKK